MATTTIRTRSMSKSHEQDLLGATITDILVDTRDVYDTPGTVDPEEEEEASHTDRDTKGKGTRNSGTTLNIRDPIIPRLETFGDRKQRSQSGDDRHPSEDFPSPAKNVPKFRNVPRDDSYTDDPFNVGNTTIISHRGMYDDAYGSPVLDGSRPVSARRIG